MAPVTKPKDALGKTFLTQYRRAAGLSQEAAARELKISRGLLSQIENAKSPYSQRLLEQASRLYGCTPADILERPPNYVTDVDLNLLQRVILSVEECCAQNPHLQPSPQEKAASIISLYRLVASGSLQLRKHSVETYLNDLKEKDK